MTVAKVPQIPCQPLARALLVSTLAVFISAEGLFPATPSTTTVVTKKIAHLPPASENPAAACAGGLANVNPVESVPWPRAKWQTPPALLPDMVPFRGKKGDQAYDRYILSAADRYDMDPAVIKAVIMAESGFNPRAVSRAGARGLMQLMPENVRRLNIDDPFDPWENIMGGARYFRQMLDRFKGKLSLSLAAYNAGPNRIQQCRRLAAKLGYDPNKWFRHTEIAAMRLIGSETVRYVSNIQKYYLAYSLGHTLECLKAQHIEALKSGHKPDISESAELARR